MDGTAQAAAIVAFVAFGANLLAGALLLLFNPRNPAVRWYVPFLLAQLIWLALQGLMLMRELPAFWEQVYALDVHFLPALFGSATLVQIFRPRLAVTLLPLAVAALVLPLLGDPLDSPLTPVWQGVAWGVPALLYFRYGKERRGARPARTLNIVLSVLVPFGVIASILLSGGFVFFALPLMTMVIHFLIFTGIVYYRFYDVEVRAARTGELATAATERDRLALLGEVSATIAHEIRNPLTGIRSLTQRIAEAPLSEETRTRYADVILGEIARLDRMVGNLTDLARRDAPGVSLEVVDLSALFEDLALLVESRARRTDVKLLVKANASHAHTAREPLAQALLNLLLNAITHTPAGGEVELCAEPAGERVLIRVRDQGPGIPEAERKRIFEPFHTDGSGTGLGLAVVRRVTEQQGWHLDITDAHPQGAEFRLLVPSASVVTA